MRLKEATVSANTGLDAIKRAPIVDYDTGLKCIRIQDISQEKSYEEWGDTETTIADYKKFKLKINDLLVARTGATVGVSFLVKEDYNAVFNNGSIRLRFNEKVNPRFVYYVFKTSSFRQYIDNVSCVATQPNLRVENLLRFNVPDYDIEMQNRIVDFLDCFDRVIENNKKRIKILEQMAEDLYKEWFVRFRFPGHEKAEFEDGIPKGWKIKRIGEVSRLINGRAYLMPELQDEGKYRIVRVGNFSGKNEWFYSDMELDEDKYCSKGDLLYKWACNFGPEIWNEEKVIFHYHIWKIVPNEMVNREYLYHFLDYTTPFWLGGTNGATMVHITKESMEKRKL